MDNYQYQALVQRMRQDPGLVTRAQKDELAETSRWWRKLWGSKAGLIDGFTRAHRHGIPLPDESAEIITLGERLRARVAGGAD
jgi:hypothetical protein